MPAKNDLNIAIISDLHLSEGRHPQTKRFNRNEDFFFDDNFDRFLSHLEKEAERRNSKWRVIIAGDMVDFLQVTRLPEEGPFELRESEREYGLGTSPAKNIWKMKVMMDGHWIFFKALGRFIAKGNVCTIITGNHDIEWTVPQVQEAFRDEMRKYLPKGTRSGKRIVSNQLEFCPWFYYEPGLIWVEHGHQYDGMNSFDYLLYPCLPNSDELMLPGGSFFVRYLFNKVEQKDPFADNIKPTSAYVEKHWLRLLLSRDLCKHIQYFLQINNKVKGFDDETLKPIRMQNERAVKAEAKRFGITTNQLNSIQKKWVPCFIYNKSKKENIKSFFCYRTPAGYYRDIASYIQKSLNVRYVVFGHTHETDLWSMSKNGKAEYTNSATWTKIFSENPGDRLLHDEQESVFIQILKDEGNKLELLKWKGELGRGDRVSLFE
jgi:UDP-2,3-diacylglucosamine pyrophosphatase LpxH